MSKFRFVRKHGKVLGPLTADRVNQLFSEGKLAPNDELGENQDGPWQSVAQLQERIEQVKKKKQVEAEARHTPRHADTSEVPAIPDVDEPAQNLETRDTPEPYAGASDLPNPLATADSWATVASFAPSTFPSQSPHAATYIPSAAAAPNTAKKQPPAESSPLSWLTNVLLGMILLVGTVIALLLASQFLGVSETATKAARTQWEYQIVTPYDELLESKLSTLGDAGWELVNARRATSEYGSPKYEMIFRRPKQDGV